LEVVLELDRSVDGMDGRAAALLARIDLHAGPDADDLS
jgi:hypothetical protein